MKAIICVGISASGKSTYANEIKKQGYIEINKDELRKQYMEECGEIFSWKTYNFKKYEKTINKRYNLMIENSVNSDIIISDTNLNKTKRDKLIKKLETLGFDVELKVFHISFIEAINRDRFRELSVGINVIAKQYENYCEQFIDQYFPDKSKDKAIIVDVDGTLAINSHRNIFDLTRVNTDTPNMLVVDIIRALKSIEYKIIVVSGREEIAKNDTIDWLFTHLKFKPDECFFRKTGDYRSDDLIKIEFFESFKNNYHIVGAIDDRPKVIMNCWKALGINTLIVGNPFIFF